LPDDGNTYQAKWEACFMVKCILCDQPILSGVSPAFKYGEPYCPKCSVRIESILARGPWRADVAPGKNANQSISPSFADVLGLISFVMALIGLVTGGVLCLIAFVMSFFAVGKERWHFGLIVLVTGVVILLAVAVLALTASAVSFF
jgi:hypothetical protein